MAVAQDRRRRLGRRTIVFIDEIHRFNKAQQDAFLPRVEAGDIVLIGATTENPSFEVNAALLSRSKVFVLKPLDVEAIGRIIRRAATDVERGLGREAPEITDDARGGDRPLRQRRRQVRAQPAAARRRDRAAAGRPPGRRPRSCSSGRIQKRALLYDKGGEEHFNIISALHKSLRNSDPDAAVYWLARMLEAGEDPLYVARRLVRFASEDIGNADPQALTIAVAAKDAVHFIGMPEGNTALAQAAIYLATAPKSNAVLLAYGAAAEAAEKDVASPVPLHLRNAPTRLMKQLDYGKGYRYAHDEADGVSDMDCLPENLQGRTFYQPTDRGFEKEIKRRLDGWKEIKRKRREDSCLDPLEVLLDLAPRDAQHHRAAVRADRRIRGRVELVENVPHLLERQRVVGLHRGVTGHRRGDPLDRLVDLEAAVEPFEVLRQRADRGLAFIARQQRRHGGDLDGRVAAELFQLEP